MSIESSREAFRKIVLIRHVELRLLQLFGEGKVSGTVHTCIGQEVGEVGVIAALQLPEDVVWSNHRGHGHYLACTDDVEGLVAEVMGKSSGTCRGVGGSQHLHRNNFYSNGVLGGTAPCAVGSAFGERALGRKSVTVVFLGDGAVAEGAVAESMNMAALWKLPIVFVVEHNGIAQTTPTAMSHAGDIAQRGSSYGIESTEISADDFDDVRCAAQPLVDRARDDNGPGLLVLHTYRLMSHSKGDDTRSVETLSELQMKDPLQRMRSRLFEVDAAWVEKTEEEVELRIDDAVVAAESAPMLGVSELPMVHA